MRSSFLAPFRFEFDSRYLDREIQNTESEKSGEDMWVPSDLESGSQEEEGSTKMEEDQGDSGGEFVSEGKLTGPIISVVEKRLSTRENKLPD